MVLQCVDLYEIYCTKVLKKRRTTSGRKKKDSLKPEMVKNGLHRDKVFTKIVIGICGRRGGRSKRRTIAVVLRKKFTGIRTNMTALMREIPGIRTVTH